MGGNKLKIRNSKCFLTADNADSTKSCKNKRCASTGGASR
jgi:hypothetical protein